MRSPIRRNKRIGFTQGGRVWNGKAVEKSSRLFTRTTWEKLSDHEGEALIIRENPSRDFFHPVTKKDVASLLSRLPYVETTHVKAVVLRRTPKYDLKMGIDARRRYSCAILNAIPRDMRMVWPARPKDSTTRHYEPWCTRWGQDKDAWVLQWGRDELRRYYLYHLLLHEIGHINEPYVHARKRREDFAENYARSWARRLCGLEPRDSE